ncbi:hypothetical protein BH10BAC6_BH10BAC6_12260 [soil metagenome]
MRMIILLLALAFSPFAVAQQVDLRACSEASSSLAIGQTILLHVQESFPTAEVVLTDTVRIPLLKEFGYADSNGVVATDILLVRIAECTVYDSATDNGFLLVEYYVRNIVQQKSDRDENIYLATMRGDVVLSKALIAFLQTDCDNTLLRGCSVQANGSLRLQQVRHVFNCATEEFVKTEQLPGSTVEIKTDGSIVITEDQ